MDYIACLGWACTRVQLVDQLAARQRLRDLVEDLRRELAALPDPVQAYEASTALIEEAREQMHALGQERAVAVHRLWAEAGRPSVTQLARMLDCSRGRAHQLLSDGRQAVGSDPAP